MDKYRQNFLSRRISWLCTLLKDVFCRPIVMNACIHLSYGRIIHRNWGDDINVFLIEALTKRKVSSYFHSSLSIKRNVTNYMAIGSTINMQHNGQTIIWGAGVIDNRQVLKSKPLKVLAVRGPLTRQYLLDNGIDCPAIYGDPAMLAQYIYNPDIRKKYRLGVIPHYDDYDHPLLANLKKKRDVLFIRMEGYRKWTDVIDQIKQCECIVSSSLHGLIMADTYEVPSLWIKISGQLLGGDFKFHDYLSSVGKDMEAYQLSVDESMDDLAMSANSVPMGQIDLKPLIAASPFELRI